MAAPTLLAWMPSPRSSWSVGGVTAVANPRLATTWCAVGATLTILTVIWGSAAGSVAPTVRRCGTRLRISAGRGLVMRCRPRGAVRFGAGARSPVRIRSRPGRSGYIPAIESHARTTMWIYLIRSPASGATASDAPLYAGGPVLHGSEPAAACVTLLPCLASEVGTFRSGSVPLAMTSWYVERPRRPLATCRS